MQVAAWAIATVVVVFGAALVQRAPAAVLALVILSAVMLLFGAWLIGMGVRGAGIAYAVVGATYVVGLGPGCAQWLRGAQGERRTKN